jgi:hypothetical protein
MMIAFLYLLFYNAKYYLKQAQNNSKSDRGDKISI